MKNLSNILEYISRQYLVLLTDDIFQLSIYDKNGKILTSYKTSNEKDLFIDELTPPEKSIFDSPLDDEVEQEEDKSVTVVSTSLRKNNAINIIALFTRLSLSEAPNLKWLCLQVLAKNNQYKNLCKLVGRLVTDEIRTSDLNKRLQQTITKQEVIIDHISDGLLVLDKNGTLQYCNAQAANILNITTNTSIGSPITEVLDFELSIQSIFRDGKGYIDRELQIESPTLRLHIIDTAIPITDENGEIISVVNTFRKIERAKQLSYRMMMDKPQFKFTDLIGNSNSIKEAVLSARKASKSTANIVLFGESGTGKELFAQSIHNDSDRKNGPFIAINCAAIPRELVESELFGYTSGSFTGAISTGKPGKFELASNGTLFLDEITEMSLDIQAKLLRVLQEQRVLRIGAESSIPIDVRIITASNKKLIEQVTEGLFREDLFYRLCVIEIEIPALRERKADINLLIDYFAEKYCLSANREKISINKNVKRQLNEYNWPGNIRQLQNIIERIVSLHDEDEITAIPANWLPENEKRNYMDNTDDLINNTFTLAEIESKAIQSVLYDNNYNITKTAKALGISRPTLYAKMSKYKLS